MPSCAVASRLKHRTMAAEGTISTSQVQRPGRGFSRLAAIARPRSTMKASGVFSRIIRGNAYQTPRVPSWPRT